MSCGIFTPTKFRPDPCNAIKNDVTMSKRLILSFSRSAARDSANNSWSVAFESSVLVAEVIQFEF